MDEQSFTALIEAQDYFTQQRPRNDLSLQNHHLQAYSIHSIQFKAEGSPATSRLVSLISYRKLLTIGSENSDRILSTTATSQYNSH